MGIWQKSNWKSAPEIIRKYQFLTEHNLEHSIFVRLNCTKMLLLTPMAASHRSQQQHYLSVIIEFCLRISHFSLKNWAYSTVTKTFPSLSHIAFKIFYPLFPSAFFYSHSFVHIFQLHLLSTFFPSLFFHPPPAAIRSACYRYRRIWTCRVAICKRAYAGWNFKFVAKEVFPLYNCYLNIIYPITAFHNYKMTRKHTFRICVCSGKT